MKRALTCTLLAAGLLLLGALGCSRRVPDKGTRAYAHEVRKAHALADHAQTPAEQAAAAQALEAVFNRPAAGPDTTTKALRQDLADRTARLHLARGEPGLALGWVEKGQEVDRAPSVLSANLLITRADSLQALGDRDRARQALMEALEINGALLDVELENP